MILGHCSAVAGRRSVVRSFGHPSRQQEPPAARLVYIRILLGIRVFAAARAACSRGPRQILFSRGPAGRAAVQSHSGVEGVRTSTSCGLDRASRRVTPLSLAVCGGRCESPEEAVERQEVPVAAEDRALGRGRPEPLYQGLSNGEGGECWRAVIAPLAPCARRCEAELSRLP